MIIKRTIVRIESAGAAILAKPPLAVALWGSGKPEAITREAFRLRPVVLGAQTLLRELQR
jgi:hypothetical protein